MSTNTHTTECLLSKFNSQRQRKTSLPLKKQSASTPAHGSGDGVRVLIGLIHFTETWRNVVELFNGYGIYNSDWLRETSEPRGAKLIRC